MDQSRRRLLATLGASATAGLAGCTSALGDPFGEPETYLDEQTYSVDASALPYPTFGDKLPEATVPAPLDDADTLTVPDDFAGSDVVMTFIYTTCMTVCPRLTAILAYLQADSLANGYGDRMSFVETTFDPARDDAATLEAWAKNHNVDLAAGNWHFLRPESKERAKEVVSDTYGVAFQRTDPPDMDMYMFAHLGLVILANKQGFVERTYKLKNANAPGDPITWKDVRDDLATLREREP